MEYLILSERNVALRTSSTLIYSRLSRTTKWKHLLASEESEYSIRFHTEKLQVSKPTPTFTFIVSMRFFLGKESTSSTFAILPVELFNDIFQHFSLREIFHSFFHVTRRLDSHIQSDRIQFRGAYLSKENHTLPRSANTKQIMSLKLVNFYSIQLVPSFIHLKSLTIEIDSPCNRQQLQRITKAVSFAKRKKVSQVSDYLSPSYLR